MIGCERSRARIVTNASDANEEYICECESLLSALRGGSTMGIRTVTIVPASVEMMSSVPPSSLTRSRIPASSITMRGEQRAEPARSWPA